PRGWWSRTSSAAGTRSEHRATFRARTRSTEAAMIRVDDSAFPLVIVALPAAWTDAEWDAYLAHMRSYPGRRTRYVTLTDARGAGTPSAAQRKRAAEVMAADEEVSKRFNVAN